MIYLYNLLCEKILKSFRRKNYIFSPLPCNNNGMTHYRVKSEMLYYIMKVYRILDSNNRGLLKQWIKFLFEQIQECTKDKIVKNTILFLKIRELKLRYDDKGIIRYHVTPFVMQRYTWLADLIISRIFIQSRFISYRIPFFFFHFLLFIYYFLPKSANL